MPPRFKYLYGPVHSWRLGPSMGIDPLSSKNKICNFSCVYCQLGKTAHFFNERQEFVSTNNLTSEIDLFDRRYRDVFINYWTFSGRGEPTLARNLGEMIRAVKKIRPEKVAVITNASLMHRPDVQKELSWADCVLAKLDVHSQEALESIDQVSEGVNLSSIVEGIGTFRQKFKGKLAIQIMFVEQNKRFAHAIARIARGINPDEVQLNTPLRACAVKPLVREDMNKIREYFHGLPTVCVYDSDPHIKEHMNVEEIITRHGICRA